jgi:LacI family transcriptional regulator
MLPAMSRVTIHDVARAAGVSVATVSKVINRRYGVASSTHAKVEQVIEELGYESSLVARSLRSHKTHVIGILVAEFEPFSTEILKGASQAIAGTGYELLAYSGGGRPGSDVGWERRYLSRLSGTLIDGALLVTPTVVEAAVAVPVVAIDPHAGPSGLATVDSDNFAGAVLATEHLLELGHRRIGFLGGREDLESSRRRERGFRHAMEAAGVPVDPALVGVGGYRKDSALGPATDLLTLPAPPTAIFAANDLSALGVLAVAARLGLRVPDDLSVIGFDDVPEAASSTPPLTTVRQPIQEMGAAGIDLLVALMGGQETLDTHVRLPTTLLVRGTTSPLR